MLKYLSSFIWNDEEVKPNERQVHLRHLLHKQIVLNNMILKSPECKPSIADELIEYQLKKLTNASKISVKKRKKRKLDLKH